jgi:hypothetical protein
MAFAQQLMPPLNALAVEITTRFGRVWATSFRAMGSAAAPIITARLLKLMSFMLISPSASKSGVTAARRASRNGNGKRKGWKEETIMS